MCLLGVKSEQMSLEGCSSIYTNPLNCKRMKRNKWSRVAAVVLAALLLWWLFWAILADEDMQQVDETDVEIME